jgi:hypothetical protein
MRAHAEKKTYSIDAFSMIVKKTKTKKKTKKREKRTARLSCEMKTETTSVNKTSKAHVRIEMVRGRRRRNPNSN